ncbi:flagellar assembly protein J [Salinarchaeum sp. Harcht-Bsk1]|uniref:archaellar assembly protein FlaJ n=1 Tax=Salinarchaeum sp. Harcht-Bsk1 TaxID=1333523 RepID=UPI0003422802|nr:archaellar assembly protein FlaJ [Salinarchaeum sp. Harcht-Bsk1]AGN02342.1 flagellar assembly protein J [Salinarchaeum sp. Harcht-Bsk1]
MSTSGSNPGATKGNLLLGAQAILDSYEEMDMPMERYLLLVIAPAASFFVFTLVATLQVPLPLVLRLPIPGLGFLGVVAAVIYPKLAQNRAKAAIGDRLHLFVTHMTILSTTNIDRVVVFRKLANEQEYGPLADEMRRIVELVDTWNQSLDDACRMRARQVPNDALADFLERLAYTLNAGQELGDFLLAEQDMIIRNYVTHYRSSLDNLEVLKDLYLSMILSMTFALVFAVVLPILTGSNPTVMVAAVIMMFFIVQLGFLYAVRVMTPNDPVWYQDDEKRLPYDLRVVASLAIAIVLMLLIVVLAILSALGVPPLPPSIHASIPLPFYVAIPITPLLVPGIVIRREEQRIRSRDEEFASFIRALGASESVKQSTTSNVLSTLRTREFGPLTDTIDNLYKRLNIRIDTLWAWDYFAAESHSFLIQKFSEMYVVGREMGGDPKVLGELISKNLSEVLQLREQRAQSTVTFVGLLYGITAAAAFAFFIGLEVVNVLTAMSAGLQTPDNMAVGNIIYPDIYNIPLIEFLLIMLVLINAMISSLMIRAADGGNSANAYMHFVFLTWIGATVGWFTRTMIGVFLQVG